MGEINIAETSGQPLWARLRAYSKVTGPGYLQSAMTLGGGTVASCAALGSMFGYKYLWVQLVAMGFGFAILAAAGKIACHTEARAYRLFWEKLHPAFAIVWALSALVATLIWHIPQYSLTANGVITLAEGFGVDLESGAARGGIGAVLFGAAAGVVYLYSAGARGLRLYELVVKLLVWGIVLAFAIAVFTGGAIDFGRLIRGVLGIDFLREGFEEAAIKPVIGALAAAVGINMLFLFPYSLMQKGWGKGYRELVYFDLLTGMAVPFVIATSLMIVAVAATIGPESGSAGTEVRDIRQIIPVISPSLGEGPARLIVGLGIAAIGFSTIITHMLAIGFTASEMLGGLSVRARYFCSLAGGIGTIGVVIKFPIPLAITASTLALPLMPLTVACFLVLLNRADVLGDERPAGGRRILWNGWLVLAIIVLSVAAFIGLQKNWADMMSLMGS